MASVKAKSKHPKRGKGLLAAVDIVIENTMAQHFSEDLTKHEIALKCEKYLPDEWINKVIDNALPNAIADRLRAAKLLDRAGNEIRRFGSYKVICHTTDGRERSYDCWKSWKHMSDDQQLEALQAQINRATNNNFAVRNLVHYVNTELRKPKGKKPLRLDWAAFRDSAI